MDGREKAILTAALLVLCLPVSAAADFDVSVTVENQVISPSDNVSTVFNVTVTNNGSASDRFYVDYLTSKPSWFSGPNPYLLELGPGESDSAIVTARPTETAVAGNQGVTFRVTNTADERVEERAVFSVHRDRDIIISNLETDKTTYDPGEMVEVEATVKNLLNDDIHRNEYQVVFTLGGEQQTEPIPSLSKGGDAPLTASFPLKKFDVGVMEITVLAQDIDGNRQDTARATIEVRETENVQVQRQDRFRVVTEQRTITAENLGNVDAPDTTVSTTVTDYLAPFTSFDRAPDETHDGEGETTYVWQLGTLAAGDSVTVQYQVNYWAPVAILLVLVIAVVVGVRTYRQPHVVKKVHRKNGKHSVHLRVENRSSKTLDNVVVKDFVPGIATLVEKFDSSPPEKIREGDEGTEIEWRLGRMQPGEERILTYRISPQVEVEEHVSLPRALLTYKAGDSEKEQYSHHARADFR